MSRLVCAIFDSMSSMIHFYSQKGSLAFADCGPVANPENGLVNTSAGTTYSKRASFICKDDYYLSGAPTITCESSGNWSNGPPECVALPLGK